MATAVVSDAITAGRGVLPSQAIERLVASGAISGTPELAPGQVQPASLDLRLGAVAYRLRASFLPGPERTVESCLEGLVLHTIALEDGAVLETGCVYLVPVMERFALPDTVTAITNPKSSTGRLDVFTRVIADRARRFDTIPAGYTGGLWIEISPRTFPVLVRSGSRLSQVRFRARGEAILDEAALAALHKAEHVVDTPAPDLANGLALTVDLGGLRTDGVIGWRARRHTGVVDVDRVNGYTVGDFWEPVSAQNNTPNPFLILDPGEFYILASREAVHIPADYAAEMVPFDPLVGEFRVHYAGFFDPGFGSAATGGTGGRAVLEVRSREVPFILEHGQTVGRLVYERLCEPATRLYGVELGSNYQAQGLKLSKHFRAV